MNTLPSIILDSINPVFEVKVSNRSLNGIPIDSPYKYISIVLVPAFNLANYNSLALSVARLSIADSTNAMSS